MAKELEPIRGELENIISAHPSLCYNCEYARKPASDENTKNGWVGCCLRVLPRSFDWDEIKSAKEVGEGWVDLKSRPRIGKGSGVITNFQLLTIEVSGCNQFNPCPPKH